MRDADMPVAVCSDGSLCCGDRACCSHETRFRIVDGEVVAASQTSASSRAEASSSETSMSSTSESPGPASSFLSGTLSEDTEPTTSSGPDKAVIIGAVLGSIVGVLLIVLAALFIRRRRRRSSKHTSGEDGASIAGKPPYPLPTSPVELYVADNHSTQGTHELKENGVTAELEGYTPVSRASPNALSNVDLGGGHSQRSRRWE